MIKRISTLLAGLALVFGLSANAQSDIKLVKGSNPGLYQLAAGDGVLGVNAQGALVVAHADGTTEGVPVENTFWCVTVTQENAGKDPIYDFLNKGAQRFLDITMDEFKGDNATPTTDAAVLGGEIGGWAFSSTFATGVEEEKPMYSHFRSDSVVGLVVNGSDVTLKTSKSTKTDIEAANFTPITLQTISAQTLTAAQINTKLGLLAKDNKKVSLKFTPDRSASVSIKNPFSDIPFYAAEVGDGTVDPGFVKIYRSADDSLLYVDTAYTNVNGVKFLAFNYAKDSATIKDIFDQAKFNFTYFPTNDSLVIQVKQAIYAPGDKGSFASAVAGPDAKSIMSAVNDGAEAEKTVGEDNNKNYVTVQDLIAADGIRIVTIHNKKESDITLGYGGCAVSSNLTSLADSVYTIQNAKGEYLAVPIANCQSGSIDEMTTASWEAVDASAQAVAHMPAYQWVVLKDKTNKYFNNISSVTAYNREYPYILADVQLSKGVNEAGDTVIVATKISGKHGAAKLMVDETEGLTFTGLTNLADSTIGYKTLSKDELKYNMAVYSLNYFNPYAMDKFVSINGKTLTATGDSTAIIGIKSVDGATPDEAYGFPVTPAVKARIASLAQLVRTPYTLYTDGLNIGPADNDASRGDAVVADKAENIEAQPCFFKENNHYNGKHYYALVVAVPSDRFKMGTYTHDYVTKCLKVGVADNTLNAALQLQCGCESRTSAFAIDITELGLYRRFNNVNLNNGENAKDSTVVLKFKESIRGEYLQDENNDKLLNTEWEKANNQTIDYAGIWTAAAAQAKGRGLGFTVDTAYVNRPYGNIKPQYLISVDRNDQAAVKGEPCTEETNTHITPEGVPTTDPYACVHATQGREGFAYGKYLVSFADSAKANGLKVPFTDVDGGYTRVGFVKAIVYKDTMIVLNYIDAAKDPAKLSPATLIKTYMASKTDKMNIIPLNNDKHKNVVWSMRYVVPSAAAATTSEENVKINSFLIESQPYDGAMIAPQNGSWLKMQNGCLTLTKNPSLFENAKTGADGALIFNVYPLDAADSMVTDAATVTTSDFSVIAGQGQVTINGAAGKKVVIRNILC